ncbi:MAG: hypothetical protein JWR21_4365 [Herminiimonas sp.]|nr:hypothetical protein [Herminiimonas sp.]
MAITRRARSSLINFKSPILKLVCKQAVLSFLIACIIVSGAVWLFGQSLTRSESLSTQEHHQPSIAPDIYSPLGREQKA